MIHFKFYEHKPVRKFQTRTPDSNGKRTDISRIWKSMGPMFLTIPHFFLISEYSGLYYAGRFLYYRGHKFTRHRVRGDKIRWQCSKQRRTQCSAAVFTVNQIIIKSKAEHNHPPPTEWWRMKKWRTKIR